MSEKRFASRKQTPMLTDAEVTQTAKKVVRKVAEPVLAGERITAQIWRAAIRLGLSYSKTKAYWYGDRRRIAHSEFQNLKARVDALHAQAAYRKAVLDDLEIARARACAAVGFDGARPELAVAGLRPERQGAL